MPKRVALLVGSAFLIVAISATIFFNFKMQTTLYGAVNGDYRSQTSGNWNAAATWQKYNGSSWVAAATGPTSTAATITIQTGHSVTVTANVTVDQVVINTDGIVILNSGITMTLANGTGTDLSVSGIFRNAGTVTVNASAVINVQNSGKYQHNYTTSPGTIPTATWTSGSTCEIIGYTTNSSSPSGLQSFSNFIWNCASQSSSINLNGGLTTINGNMTIASTGSSMLYLASAASTLSVGGTFTHSGGTFSLSNSSGITSTLAVTGAYLQSAGTFSVVDGSNATGVVNVFGNYSHTGGTLTVGGNSSTTATVNFKKSGTQTFTASSNTVTGNVDFVVFSGAILSLGTNTVTGRNFTLSAGGGLQLGSPNGITSSGASGNIQVSGTRSFNIGSDYTYNGSSAQQAGNGLPSTVRNLTINNSSSLTLAQNTAVSNVLTLTTGKLYTGSFEIATTSSASGAITGNTSSSYIIGNLRRTVSSSGVYAYPLGTATLYELMTLTLSGTSGFTTVLGNFVNSNPNDTVNSLSSITVSGVDMTELLDYGYWTLTPNLPLTSGSYSVELNEQGYTNLLGSGTIYSVLYRPGSLLSWSDTGTHADNTQSVSGGVVTAVRSTYSSFGEYAIALGDFISFNNPSLYSGTAGAIGAIYIFPNVMRMIDAWVEITDIQGGASLSTIDDPSVGYDESFQPFIRYAVNDTGYLEWRITFKKAGTATDTTLLKMTATGVDVDGSISSGKYIREFIDATMPTSYSLDPATNLTITNLSGHYRAMGSTTNISNIDTSQRQAMYQLNYNNVNSIMYRTGAASTMTSTQTRQTSLYFRSFNLTVGNIALPIKLTYFGAKLRQNRVDLTWTTATETNNDYFTIERSTDGESFEKLLTKRGAGNSTTTRNYEATDDNPLPGYSFYRLKQTDYDGHFTYSDIKTVNNKGEASDLALLEIKNISPNPFTSHFEVNFISRQRGSVEISILNSSGAIVAHQKAEISEGYNNTEFRDLENLQDGIYFVTLICGETRTVKKIIKSGN